MKKILLLTLICLTGLSFVRAQKTITVQSNGNASFYTDWASAWAATQDGDTIYLPGGTFATGNIVLDRKVSIIGVGHDATQTHDGLFSHLNGNIYFAEGSDETFLHGFQTGSLFFYHASQNQVIQNITISRCRIAGQVYLGYSAPSPAQYVLFNENVFNGRIYGVEAQHIQFYKNFIDERISNFNGTAVFSNNIFSFYYSSNSIYAPVQSTKNVLFQNNVFRSTSYPMAGNSENNLLQNNIFAANITPDPQTDLNIWIGNFFNQPMADVFVNFTTGGFNPDNDYHLLPTSVGIDAATDGFDIGIYGTAVPYKEGAVPFNPQITFEQVSGQTNDEGNIEVQVNVSAQDR